MTRDYHINVFYSQDDGGYIADLPDLDTCSAFGTSPQAALEEVLQAKDAWLAAASTLTRDRRQRARHGVQAAMGGQILCRPLGF